jgi:hypothetical protein
MMFATAKTVTLPLRTKTFRPVRNIRVQFQEQEKKKSSSSAKIEGFLSHDYDYEDSSVLSDIDALGVKPRGLRWTEVFMHLSFGSAVIMMALHLPLASVASTQAMFSTASQVLSVPLATSITRILTTPTSAFILGLAMWSWKGSDTPCVTFQKSAAVASLVWLGTLLFSSTSPSAALAAFTGPTMFFFVLGAAFVGTLGLYVGFMNSEDPEDFPLTFPGLSAAETRRALTFLSTLLHVGLAATSMPFVAAVCAANTAAATSVVTAGCSYVWSLGAAMFSWPAIFGLLSIGTSFGARKVFLLSGIAACLIMNAATLALPTGTLAVTMESSVVSRFVWVGLAALVIVFGMLSKQLDKADYIKQQGYVTDH